MARFVSDQLQQDQPQRLIIEQAPTTTTAATPTAAAATRAILTEGIAAPERAAMATAEAARESEAVHTAKGAMMAAMMAAVATVKNMGVTHHLLFHICHDALRYILKILIVKSYDRS
jgi:hypothetical protein